MSQFLRGPRISEAREAGRESLQPRPFDMKSEGSAGRGKGVPHTPPACSFWGEVVDFLFEVISTESSVSGFPCYTRKLKIILQSSSEESNTASARQCRGYSGSFSSLIAYKFKFALKTKWYFKTQEI